jgi:hypothetical protein
MYPSLEVRKDPESSCVEVARLRLQLTDQSLSELVQKGVLERNEGDNGVRKGERFTEVWNDIM